MNKNLCTIAAALVLLTFGALGSGAQAQDFVACNNRLIGGSYGFAVNGAKLAGPPGTPIGPQVGVAMAEFDGRGNFSQIDTVTIAGVTVADFTHTPATGTYTVNSDCTGTFTLNFTDGRPTVTTNFVVVNDGFEIDTVVTSAGGNQGILATGSVGKRISRRR
ncbi:MAG: hypothetical protein WBQ08_11090 [Candidatus Sulfotelmatobacter sp.]